MQQKLSDNEGFQNLSKITARLRCLRNLTQGLWELLVLCCKRTEILNPVNATTHTFLKRSRQVLSKNVWVVALIPYRFREKRI